MIPEVEWTSLAHKVVDCPFVAISSTFSLYVDPFVLPMLHLDPLFKVFNFHASKLSWREDFSLRSPPFSAWFLDPAATQGQTSLTYPLCDRRGRREERELLVGRVGSLRRATMQTEDTPDRRQLVTRLHSRLPGHPPWPPWPPLSLSLSSSVAFSILSSLPLIFKFPFFFLLFY